MEWLGLVALIGAGVFGVLQETRRQLRQHWDRRYMLVELAAMLHGEHDDDCAAHGTALGLPATVRFGRDGVGAGERRWTELEIALPHRYPLTMHIRPHHEEDRRRIARGDMVDLDNADPAFDRRFLVEAAPIDVVHRLLDGATRNYLLQQRDVELTVDVDDRLVVRLALQTWLRDPAQARAALRVVAGLARRVREVYQQLYDAPSAPALATGGPYRPSADAQPERDARAAREAEVARVAGLRRRRSS
jgi:hypothetical protein